MSNSWNLDRSSKCFPERQVFKAARGFLKNVPRRYQSRRELCCSIIPSVKTKLRIAQVVLRGILFIPLAIK